MRDSERPHPHPPSTLWPCSGRPRGAGREVAALPGSPALITEFAFSILLLGRPCPQPLEESRDAQAPGERLQTPHRQRGPKLWQAHVPLPCFYWGGVWEQHSSAGPAFSDSELCLFVTLALDWRTSRWGDWGLLGRRETGGQEGEEGRGE